MEKYLRLPKIRMIQKMIQNYLCAAIFVLLSFPDPHGQPQVRVHKFLSRVILQSA